MIIFSIIKRKVFKVLCYSSCVNATKSIKTCKDQRSSLLEKSLLELDKFEVTDNLVHYVINNFCNNAPEDVIKDCLDYFVFKTVYELSWEYALAPRDPVSEEQVDFYITLFNFSPIYTQ